jgi:hypothetical protein
VPALPAPGSLGPPLSSRTCLNASRAWAKGRICRTLEDKEAERLNEIEQAARESVSAGLLPRWLQDWLPEVVLLLVTTGAGLWAAGRWIDPCGDPGYFWSLAYRLSKGERLYRDIYLPYTPLSPYLFAGWARLFGLSARSFLLANWIPAVLAGVLLLRCARSFLSTLERLALVGVVLATSLFLPDSGRLVLSYHPGAVHALALSIGALLLVRSDQERVTRRAFLAGLLAGLAFCCKQEIGIAAILALTMPVLAGLARPLLWLTRLFAGFCAALLPAAAFVLSCASLESLRRDSRLWPLAPVPSDMLRRFFRHVAGFDNPNWLLDARATAFRSLCWISLLALAALLIARERRRSAWLRALGLLAGLGSWWLLEGDSLRHPLLFLSLSMSVAFLVAILAFFSRDLPGRAFLLSFGVFAGLAGARVAFSANVAGHYSGPGHLAAALTSLLFVVVFVPRLILGQTRAASYLRASITLVLLAFSWSLTVRDIRILRFPGKVPVDTREGRIFVEPAKAELFNAIARVSTAGEREVVIPETYAVDVLFHLEDVSPLLYGLPVWLDQDIERRIVKRLEKSPPDLVVLFERPVKEFGLEPFGVGYGLLLADWCSRNYQVTESFAAGKILRKRPTGARSERPVRPFRTLS